MSQTDQHKPSVRVDLDLPEAGGSAPKPDMPTDKAAARPLLAASAAVLLAVVGLVLTIGRSDRTPDRNEEPAAAANIIPSGREIVPVVADEIAVEIDSLVRDGNLWLTIVDGVLFRSADLIEWDHDFRVSSPASVALAGSGDDVRVLAAASTGYEVVELGREVLLDSGSRIEPAELLGALDGKAWAAVVGVEGISNTLTLGDGDDELVLEIDASVAVTSVAVEDGIVLLTVTDSEGTTLHSIEWKSTQSPQRCALPDLPTSRLVTSGDGAVHLVADDRAWAVAAERRQLELAVDASDLLSTIDADMTLQPLANGGGWSASVTDFGGTQVYVSSDGRRFEQLRYPNDIGFPMRVVWAGVNGQAGVEFLTLAGEEVVVAVDDGSGQHPSGWTRPPSIQLDWAAEPMLFQGSETDCEPVESARKPFNVSGHG